MKLAQNVLHNACMQLFLLYNPINICFLCTAVGLNKGKRHRRTHKRDWPKLYVWEKNVFVSEYVVVENGGRKPPVALIIGDKANRAEPMRINFF